jgi:multidrug efflux system membrane fusion protein
VRIKIAISDKPDVLMVPQVALGSSQLGKYLYVVGAGDKVEQRLVKLGPTHGELVAVYDGIKEDDRIIVGNLQKIGPGAPVHPLSNDQASAAHNVKVD